MHGPWKEQQDLGSPGEEFLAYPGGIGQERDCGAAPGENHHLANVASLEVCLGRGLGFLALHRP